MTSMPKGVPELAPCPQAWNLTGDEFTQRPGERSWMSEMYGYAYGAAVAGVWHRKMDYTHSLLPGYAALYAQPV